MQQLREQRSQRSAIITIGKNTGVKMRYNLIGKRDFGLRPLAGAQGHVARRDLGVGALARGHARLLTAACASDAPPGCATLVRATRSQLAGCAPLALQTSCRGAGHISKHLFFAVARRLCELAAAAAANCPKTIANIHKIAGCREGPKWLSSVAPPVILRADN